MPDTRDQKVDDGTRRIDEKQQALVEAAYEAIAASDKTITDIAVEWNVAKIYGLTGKPWSTSTVSLFLRSPRNAGLREYGGEIVGKGTWTALVDEKLWRRVQTVLDGHAHGPKSVQHLLTGVMRCGKDGCEGRLAGKWAMQPTGGKPGRPKAGQVKEPSGEIAHAITYTCKSCRGVAVRAAHVEPIVLRALVKRLTRADAVELLRKKVYDPAEAAKLNAEEKVLLGRLTEINYDRAKGKLDGASYYEMKDVMIEDLAAVERRRHDQESTRVLTGIPLGTDQAADAVEALSPERLRKVLDLLLVITVNPVGKSNKVFDRNRVHITWK